MERQYYCAQCDRKIDAQLVTNMEHTFKQMIKSSSGLIIRELKHTVIDITTLGHGEGAAGMQQQPRPQRMTRIDHLISEYGQACLAHGGTEHGRTKRQRQQIKERKAFALAHVVETRKALVAELNRVLLEVRRQHRAVLATYGQHHLGCDQRYGKTCSCGLGLLLEEDLFTPERA